MGLVVGEVPTFVELAVAVLPLEGVGEVPRQGEVEGTVLIEETQKLLVQTFLFKRTRSIE